MPMIKISRGGTLTKAEVPTDALNEDDAVLGRDVQRWCVKNWRGFRVSKMIYKGKVINEGDRVLKGKVVMVLGETTEVIRGKRSEFVSVADLMSCVFCFLPLQVVRRTCAAVCRQWSSMTEMGTRHHPHRYACEGGHLFDIFSSKPKSLFEKLSITPSTVVDSSICDEYLYLLVSMDPGLDSKHADEDGGGGGGGGGDDDDAASVSSSSSTHSYSSADSNSGDDDHTPAQKDAAFQVHLGLTGVSDGLTIHDITSDMHTLRNFRVKTQKQMRKQRNWNILCVNLIRESLVWRATNLFQRSFNLPIVSFGSTKHGAVVAHGDLLTLYDRATGLQSLREFKREEGWTPLFSKPFWVAKEPWVYGPARKAGVERILVPQRKHVFILSSELELLQTVKTSVIIKELKLIDLNSSRAVVLTIDNELVCLSTKGTGKEVLWRETSVPILHYSPTNTLLDGMLFDSDANHFAMPISKWKEGGCLSLLEGTGEDCFAEGVFMHNNTSLDTIELNADSFKELLVTDTKATHPFATNTSLCPQHSDYDIVETLSKDAPARVVFNPAQDFNSPHNIEARRYNAFSKKLSEVTNRVQREVWKATQKTQISLKAICREFVKTANPSEPEIRRTLKEIWSILIPFPVSSLTHAVKEGNILYVGIWSKPYLGVYAVAVDRGFLKWRALWEQKNVGQVQAIEVTPLQGVLTLSLTSHSYRHVTFLNTLSGRIQHAAKLRQTNWYA